MTETVILTRETVQPARPAAAATLLAFAGADGIPRRWRLIAGGAVIGRGDDLAELPEQRAWVRTVLAVPGADVGLHWLELAESLTAAQAAAAARLQLGDDVPEAMDALHVAAGRREGERTAVALVPAARMQAWLDEARALAVDPDVVIPAPLLLMPPGEGLVRHDGGTGAPDYRGVARAFSLEDELASLVIGDETVTDVGDDVREAGFGPALAAPMINLRQGDFAKRRERTALDRGRINWLITLGIVLLIVSLLIEINAVVRQTFETDRILAEAKAIGTDSATAGPQAAPRGGFGAAAGAVFDAVRDTPAATLTQIVYLADGSMRVSLLADSQATIDGIRARIEGRGMSATAGLPANLGGRAAAEITVRPR